MVFQFGVMEREHAVPLHLRIQLVSDTFFPKTYDWPTALKSIAADKGGNELLHIRQTNSAGRKRMGMETALQSCIYIIIALL